jgi:hypothetical protein
LLSFDGKDIVCFRTKHGKTTSVDAVEFMRRFLLHVLPAGFVKIRHYGLLAAANPETPPTWSDLFLILTGTDLLVSARLCRRALRHILSSLSPPAAWPCFAQVPVQHLGACFTHSLAPAPAP